jgi:hypothetical protein
MACGVHDQTQRVAGYLFTLYTMPRTLHAGDARVALRIQDRDYRIITQADVRMVVVDPEGQTRTPVKLEPGAGKDFRADLYLPHGGEYRLNLQVAPRALENAVMVEYRIRVSE